jgi:hypothetical protein
MVVCSDSCLFATIGAFEAGFSREKTILSARHFKFQNCKRKLHQYTLALHLDPFLKIIYNFRVDLIKRTHESYASKKILFDLPFFYGYIHCLSVRFIFSNFFGKGPINGRFPGNGKLYTNHPNQ